MNWLHNEHLHIQYVINTYTHSIRTKNERAEQFSKRMHKEGQLTKAQKDEIKSKNMA